MSDTAGILESLVAHLTAGLLTVSTVGVSLWKADNLISEDGRKLIYCQIILASRHPESSALDEQIRGYLGGYFSRDVPFFKFVRNVLLFSIASLFVVLCLYIGRTSGLFGQLTSDAFARRQFLTQFLGNGLVVVVIVNYVGAVFIQYLLGRENTNWTDTWKLLLGEAVIKIVLFVALTMLIYVIFALYRGAFVGSPALALRAVRPTILNALFFQNLTSVYIYSVAISSFPLFIVALLDVLRTRPGFAAFIRTALFWLPLEKTPLRAIAILLGIALFLFLLTAFALLSLLALIL